MVDIHGHYHFDKWDFLRNRKGVDACDVEGKFSEVMKFGRDSAFKLSLG